MENEELLDGVNPGEEGGQQPSEGEGTAPEQGENSGEGQAAEEQGEPITVVEVTADLTETNQILIGGLFCIGLIFGALLMSLFWSRFRRF